MSFDLADLRAFEEKLREEIPGFEVRYKNESTFMKVLGFLIFPFNQGFVDRFKTTIGKIVYFPTKTEYEADPESSFRTLSHEYVHLWDDQKHGFKFGLSYMFPQLLAIIPLLVFGVLAWPHSWLLAAPLVGWVLGSLIAHKNLIAGLITIGTTVAATVAASFFLLVWWKGLVLLAGLACVAPWPAPWRTQWELRGYTMSAAVVSWMLGPSRVTSSYKEHIIKQFVGPNYFFMSWNRGHVERVLNDGVRDAANGSLQEHSPYRVVFLFLYNRSLLHV